MDGRTAGEVDGLELVGDPAAVLGATGKYTNVAQSPANTSQPLNLRRSATAPEISATVMMANINWNATNTDIGMVPASGMLTSATASMPAAGSAMTSVKALPPINPLRPKYWLGSPNSPNLSLPNANEYP